MDQLGSGVPRTAVPWRGLADELGSVTHS